MSSYARAHSALDDPWMAWRIEPPEEPGAGLVHSLNEEEFYCARVAYHIHSNSDIQRRSSVPTDGDIEDIPGHLENRARLDAWREWLEVLGPPPSRAHLSLAIAAAKHDITEGPIRSDSELGIRIAELADQVSAFQMPTIERLESIGSQIDAYWALRTGSERRSS